MICKVAFAERKTIFPTAPETVNFKIGQSYDEYVFPDTSAREGEEVKYEFEKQEYLDFLQIDFDQEVGNIVLKTGQVPSDFEPSQIGE